MKKIFTLVVIFAAFISNAVCEAKDYTDDLVVTIDGVSTDPMSSTISVEADESGTYTLSLKNFMLVSGEDVMPVGNITLTGVEGKTLYDGSVKLSASQTIYIENGDTEGVTFWIGSMLGAVPVEVEAVMIDEAVYAEIFVNMEENLGYNIDVVFGSPIATTEAYTDNLVVTLGEYTVAPVESTIYVTTETDGTYTLSLLNFVLSEDGSDIAVGNIVVTGIEGVEQEDGSILLATSQDITIEAGDLEGVTFWLGPALETLTVTVSATLSDDALYAVISLPFDAYGTINVVFGTDTTGIQSVQTATAAKADGATYNLQGVKVGSDYKGIVIQNGRKIIRK